MLLGLLHQEYKCGDIEVSNTAHPKLTQVTVTADLYSPGLLLQLASVMHGQGISVAEAVIRGGVDNPIPAELTQIELPDPPPGKRVLRFWVADIRDHAKLVRNYWHRGRRVQAHKSYDMVQLCIQEWRPAIVLFSRLRVNCCVPAV